MAAATFNPSTFKVDVHTHPIPEFYRDALVAAGYKTTDESAVVVDGFNIPDFNIAEYIRERVADTYNYSILSITAPGVSFLNGNSQAVTLARQLNDQMAEYSKTYPMQLGAFGCLPLPDIESSLAEIRYCLDELNFEGIGLFTNYNGKYLGDEFLNPIFDELDRRRATVFVHPTNPSAAPGLPGMSLPVIEYTFDTTRAVANLLFSRTRQRYPNMKMIFSHGGGTLPFLAERLAVQTTLPFHGGRDRNESMRELRGYYFDTAVVLGAPQLSSLKEFVGAGQLLTGSDYPYLPGRLVPSVQEAFNRYEDFTEEEKQLIGWKNAFELFPSLKQKFSGLHG